MNGSGTTPATLTARSVVMTCLAPTYIGSGAYSASQVGGFFGAGSNGNSDTFTSTLTGVFINGANENGVAAFDASTLSSFFTTKTYIGAVQNSTDTSFAGWTCNSAIANFGSTSSACTSLPIT